MSRDEGGQHLVIYLVDEKNEMSRGPPGFRVSDRADGAALLRWRTLGRQTLGVQGEMNFGCGNN